MTVFEYITLLGKLKSQAEGRWLSAMPGIEKDVLEKSYQWLVENLEINRGEIEVNEDLAFIMDQFVQATVDMVNSSRQFNGTIGRFLGDLSQISANNKKFHKTTNNFDIDTAGVNDAQKAVIADIIDQYTGNGLNAHFAAPLKENVFRNMLAGADMKDVRKVLEEYILSGKDKSGKLKSYIDQTAMQAVDTYTGVINQQLMKEFKYTGLIISGSLIETSSKQCVLAVTESGDTFGYLPNAEWEKILEVARNNPKAKLIQGTTLETLPINKLHWGCRHDFTPTIMEEAAAAPKKADPKDEPKKPADPAKQPQNDDKAVYVEAKDKPEARKNFSDIIKKSGVKVTGYSFSRDITVEQMNARNKQLADLVNEYRISDAWDKTQPTKASYQSTSRAYGFVQPARNAKGGLYIQQVDFGSKTDSDRADTFEPADMFAKQFKSKVDKDNLEVATVVHEYAHFISISGLESDADFFKELTALRKDYSQHVAKTVEARTFLDLRDTYLGKYASVNINEFMAEGFTEYKLSSDPGTYATKIGKLIDKYFKK